MPLPAPCPIKIFTGFSANSASAPRPCAQSLMARMFGPVALIADMDQRGIDMAVVTACTVLHGTSWADPATDLELWRRCYGQAAD